MQNFLIGFATGFGLAVVIAIGWYHGSLKPHFDALKQVALDKISAARDKQ